MPKLEVKLNKISLTGNAVVVDSPKLVHGLIHSQKEVLGLLAKSGTEVALKNISIDNEGNVVIENPKFRKELESAMSKIDLLSAADANGICGVHC